MSSIPIHRIPLGQGTELRQPDDLQAPESGDSSAFSKALKSALDDINETQEAADASVEDFVKGEEVPIHEVMVKLTEADTSMKLMPAVPTKALQAYQEISRMQI